MFSQEELALIWVLLISTVMATFFIQHYKITYIPPSGAAMALGMVYGGFAKLAGAKFPLFCIQHYKFISLKGHAWYSALRTIQKLSKSSIVQLLAILA